MSSSSVKFHKLSGVSIAGLVISSLLLAIGVEAKVLALLTRGVWRGRARRAADDLRALDSMLLKIVPVMALVMISVVV
jgi:hypothetical protein